MKKILFFKNYRFLRVKLKNLRIIHVKFNVVCDCFEENHGYLAFFSCKIGKRRLLLVINGLKNSKKDSEFVIKMLIYVKFYVTNVENWIFFT